MICRSTIAAAQFICYHDRCLSLPFNLQDRSCWVELYQQTQCRARQCSLKTWRSSSKLHSTLWALVKYTEMAYETKEETMDVCITAVETYPTEKKCTQARSSSLEHFGAGPDSACRYSNLRANPSMPSCAYSKCLMHFQHLTAVTRLWATAGIALAEVY